MEPSLVYPNYSRWFQRLNSTVIIVKFTRIEFSFPELDVTTIKKTCDQCNKYTKNAMNLEYKNAVIVELQDTEPFNDLDRPPVFLFDNDTEGIRVSEKVVVTGDIEIKNNNKKYLPYL